MTDVVRHRHDIDKEHLRNIAMELKDILKQLHHSKKTSFDIWEGNKASGKSIMTNRIGSNYEIQYVKGKVTDDDLLDKASPTYQSPDAERFQQDVWEPGSRGEGTMLGGISQSIHLINIDHSIIYLSLLALINNLTHRLLNCFINNQ